MGDKFGLLPWGRTWVGNIGEQDAEQNI